MLHFFGHVRILDHGLALGHLELLSLLSFSVPNKVLSLAVSKSRHLSCSFVPFPFVSCVRESSRRKKSFKLARVSLLMNCPHELQRVFVHEQRNQDFFAPFMFFILHHGLQIFSNQKIVSNVFEPASHRQQGIDEGAERKPLIPERRRRNTVSWLTEAPRNARALRTPSLGEPQLTTEIFAGNFEVRSCRGWQ